MYTVAILADVHGNLAALEAVLTDIDRQRPDEVLVGGDLVGRGPQGSAVVAAIAARGWPSIRGNHEDYLLDFRHRRVPDDWLEDDEWAASRWMATELDEPAVRVLEGLPPALRPRAAPDLLLVHGSPSSYNEGLGPWTPDTTLRRHLASVEERLLVCAHTHRPMQRRLAEGEVVNVGSVGLPFNRDRRAQYALFRWSGDAWRVEPRQVAYDVDRTLKIYRTSGFLDAGGVTARLLELELRHATPYLVPFLQWASRLGVRPEASRLDEFRDFYDPDEPLHDLYLRLQALRR